MKKRYVVTKNGKPFRAYFEMALAILVMELCEDIKPSCKWDITVEYVKL